MISDSTQSPSQITQASCPYTKEVKKSRGTQRPQVKYLIATENGINNKIEEIKVTFKPSFQIKFIFKSVTAATALIQAEHSFSLNLLSQLLT